jgi:hypothetical protein
MAKAKQKALATPTCAYLDRVPNNQYFVHTLDDAWLLLWCAIFSFKKTKQNSHLVDNEPEPPRHSQHFPVQIVKVSYLIHVCMHPHRYKSRQLGKDALAGG